MKRHALATLGAAVLMASAVVTGSAATTASNSTDVDIVVTSTGTLSVEITETEPFDNVTYSFEDQTVEGVLTIEVTDERGTAAGWTFNLRGTGDFTGAANGPGDSFPLTGLSLTHSTTTAVAGNPSITGVSGLSLTQVTTSGQQIATASPDAGNGQYDLVFNGSLEIPGDTLVDTYKTTIVVEVPANP